MIFKMKKSLSTYPEDFAVKTEVGELLCKIAVLHKGFYIYNKLGEQIAQITTYNNTARLSIGHATGNTRTVASLAFAAPDRFEFLDNIYGEDDQPFLANIRDEKTDAFSIWGNVRNYSFDIYNGKVIEASISGDPADSSRYLVKINESANILKIIMIVVAAEDLSIAKAR